MIKIVEEISEKLDLSDDQKEKLAEYIKENIEVVTCERFIGNTELLHNKKYAIEYTENRLYELISDKIKTLKACKISQTDHDHGITLSLKIKIVK